MTSLAYDDNCDNRTNDDQHSNVEGDQPNNVEGDQPGDNSRTNDQRGVEVSGGESANPHSNTVEITTFASQSIMSNPTVRSRLVTTDRFRHQKAVITFGSENGYTIGIRQKFEGILPVLINDTTTPNINSVAHNALIELTKGNGAYENAAPSFSEEIVTISDWSAMVDNPNVPPAGESTLTSIATTTDAKLEKNDPKHFKKKAEIDPVILDISANSELLNNPPEGNRQQDTFATPPADFDI
uniref:Uncharacterized protein n=1 Tax=Romanomermis culicivorax TaxID=13658 RepID=A0A915JAJ9_ROMCU